MVDNPLKPHGAVPGYIPPHLQGKVWDFRNEPGGDISFQHPEAALGLAPDQSRVTMSPDEYRKNFDAVDRWTNFEESMREGYAPMQRRPKTPAREMNDWIADKARGAFDWGTSSQGKAVGTAGLLSALAGAAGGAAWGHYSGSGKISKALMLALLAGGLGATGTALAQNKHNKREAWLSKGASSADVSHMLIRMLNNDPTINGTDRAMIFRAIASASSSDRDSLYRLLRGAAGAGVGVLAMRFLGAKGLLPMAAGGILGGLIGGRSSGLKRNALGQVSITNYT